MTTQKNPANAFYGKLKSEADRLLKQNRKLTNRKSRNINKHLTSIAIKREKDVP